MRKPILLALLLLAACDRAATTSTPAAAPAPAEVPYRISDWPLPAVGAAAQPDLILAPDGALLLSWIAAQPEGGHALSFARFDGGRWNAPRRIAYGTDWFVNWADTPHLAATADGALWAHWLRRTAEAAYAYDVVLTRSSDGGTSWSDAIQVNDDGTATEHGFVSLWPQARDAIGIAWLDGRNMAGAAHGDEGGHGGGGAMTLRTARFDAAMRKSGESELDPRTCDCCQTDAAMTARGPLLTYRDRDGGEIRDVVVSRLDQGVWTLPRKVHDDRWKMPACPVNGPALAARDARAWVAWYTAAGDAPKIRIAHSADAGDTFAAPRDADQGEAVQGRVGIAVDGETVWLSWLREDAQGQSLWLARYRADLSGEPQRWRIAMLQGRGRATGFPQLAAKAGVAYLAWTDVADGKPMLRGARIARRAEAVTPPPATPAPATR
jgi:hypothetical protein